MLGHHLADLVALLLDDGFLLHAAALDLLLGDLGHPHLAADLPRRALLLDLHDRAGAVAPLAGAGIALPAAGLADAPRDHRAGHFLDAGFPAAGADLDRLCVLHRLADRAADILRAGLPHRLTDRVMNLLGPRLLDRLADGVRLLTLLVARLADRIGDLLRARLIDRLAHRIRLLTGLVARLADGVGHFLRAGFVHRLADGVGLLAGFIDGLAHRVWHFLLHRLVHRLAHRVRLLTGLVHRLADRVRNLLLHRLVHRLAHRVGLLTGLIHRLADRVRNLLGARLIYRSADRVGDFLLNRLVDGLADGVGLLAGFVHRPADRIRNLLRPRLVDGLADGIRNRPRASLPHWLAHGVGNFLAAPLSLVAGAVDLPLLDNLLADGLVAGVLPLLVDDVLDQPRATARRRRGAGRIAHGLIGRAALPRRREADGHHLACAAFIAGQATVGCISHANGCHMAREGYEATNQGSLHDCRLCRGRLRDGTIGERNAGTAAEGGAPSMHPQPSTINSPQVDRSP